MRHAQQETKHYYVCACSGDVSRVHACVCLLLCVCVCLFVCACLCVCVCVCEEEDEEEEEEEEEEKEEGEGEEEEAGASPLLSAARIYLDVHDVILPGGSPCRARLLQVAK